MSSLEDHTDKTGLEDLPSVTADDRGPRNNVYILVSKKLAPVCATAYRTDCVYEENGRLYAAKPFPHIFHPEQCVGEIGGQLVFEPPHPALHFVGFRGDEYGGAVRVFGPPDFIHRLWDIRAAQEIAEDDIVVFAKYHEMESTPTHFTFDDSGPQGFAPEEERK